jgi:HlyD family secretion protein
MNSPSPHLKISGAAMDKIVPRRRGKVLALRIGAVLGVLAAIAAVWYWMPSGLKVDVRDIRTAEVQRGMFVDDVVVRSTAEPLRSIILDSIESGRVEEVLVRDGALVTEGQLLFRLSNSQRNLELLARESEVAQQIFNIENLRVAQEASRSDHERRLADLDYALEQAEKQYARQRQLAEQGFVSSVALEEARDRVEQHRRLLDQARKIAAADARIRDSASKQLTTAIKNLQAGLKVVGGTVAALSVRAPQPGRLTGFSLQVGQTVSTGKHIGRIDDPDHFKLLAQVDEYYRNRLSAGQRGVAQHGGQRYPVAVRTVYPQIKEGRFSVELEFVGKTPASLNPGQSLDTQITLSEPAPALLLTNGPYINDTGGAWVFVVTSGGDRAERRQVKVGRRNNNQVEVLSGLAPGERVIVSSYAAFATATSLQLSR